MTLCEHGRPLLATFRPISGGAWIGGSELEHVHAYERHMRRRGFTAGSVDAYSSALRAFARWLEPRTLYDAGPEDIDTFLALRRGKSGGELDKRTRYSWVSRLHKFYEWSVIHDLTGWDPTIRVDRPRLHKRFPRPMSESDLAMALECADRMMYVWLMLAGFAGLRCMEIGGMDSDWVLREEGFLRVLGKGDKERMVPIHPALQDALDDWRLPRRGPVFTRPRGGRWPARYVSREGNVFLEGLGINATMHQARHRFGTKFYAACKDLLLTQEVMGHSSSSTTEGYVAVNNAEARAAVLGLPTFQQELAIAD